MGLFSLITGIYSYKKQKEAAVAQQEYYNFLADTYIDYSEALQKYSDRQVDYIEDTADKIVSFTQDIAAYDTKMFRREVRKIEGTQRATMAASGVALSSVTAEDIVNDTANRAAEDEAAIRYKADIESWKTKNQASIQAWETKYQTALKTWNLLNQATSMRLAGKNAYLAGEAGATSGMLKTIGDIGNDIAWWSLS